MANLVDKINTVEDKILRLLKKQDALKQENLDLKKKVGNQQEELLILEEKLETLKNNNHNLKSANALLGSNEFKRETKLKINSLIREIDHCIGQLSE